MKTWMIVPARFAVAAVLILASHSAGAGENVWTTNGPPGQIFTLAIDPVSLTLYAGSLLPVNRTVAFRSSDRGASWVESGEAPPSSWLSVLAVSPTMPTIAYASVNSGPFGGKVYRSGDEGSTWVEAGSLMQRDLWNFAFPKDQPGTLFGAGSECYCVGVPCFYRIECSAAVLKSDDSGMNWRLLTSRLTNRLSGRKTTAVVLDPVDPNRIYAAGDGGVFVSADGGVHWSSSNSGIEGCSSVRSLVVRPSDGTLLIATASSVPNTFACGGIFRSSDGARSWTPIGPPTQIATSLALDPTDPRVVYAGTNSGAGVYRSEDGGDSWGPLGSIPGSPTVSQIVVEPSGRVIHAATSLGVFDFEIVPGARPPVVPPRSRDTRTLPPRP